MGALISLLADFMSIVHLLLDPVYQFRKAYARAALDPGLPVPSPTYPRWMRDPPHPDLQERQSDKLPSKVDVAIIGSGISGAAAAYSLLHSDNESKFSKIAVFEARDLCSGATARNGGHIKAAAWECYPRIKKHLGPERAAVLTRFQRNHLDVLVRLCEDLHLDAAEAREVETVDLFLDSESFETAVKKANETVQALPEEEYKIFDRLEAQKVRRLLIFCNFGNAHTSFAEVWNRSERVWSFVFQGWRHMAISLCHKHLGLSLEEIPRQLVDRNIHTSDQNRCGRSPVTTRLSLCLANTSRHTLRSSNSPRHQRPRISSHPRSPSQDHAPQSPHVCSKARRSIPFGLWCKQIG